MGHRGPSPEQSEIIPLRICNALVRGPRVSVVASVECEVHATPVSVWTSWFWSGPGAGEATVTLTATLCNSFQSVTNSGLPDSSKGFQSEVVNALRLL